MKQRGANVEQLGEASEGERTGYLVEFGEAYELFASPREDATKRSIRGEFREC